MEPEKIKILVVDDNYFMRKTLRLLIGMGPNCRVAGEADNSEQALKDVKENDYDVILVDISLEGDDSGIELIEGIRKLGKSTPILILSLHEQSLYLERIRKAGAQGYLMKQNATDSLIPAIQQLSAGQTYWPAGKN